MTDFERFRISDGSINLEAAANTLADEYKLNPLSTRGFKFIRAVERLRPVTSRQIAALALAMAEALEDIE